MKRNDPNGKRTSTTNQMSSAPWNSLQTPKSAMRSRPSSPSSRFDGLMSRWMTWLWCTASTETKEFHLPIRFRVDHRHHNFHVPAKIFFFLETCSTTFVRSFIDLFAILFIILFNFLFSKKSHSISLPNSLAFNGPSFDTVFGIDYLKFLFLILFFVLIGLDLRYSMPMSRSRKWFHDWSSLSGCSVGTSRTGPRSSSSNTEDPSPQKKMKSIKKKSRNVFPKSSLGKPRLFHDRLFDPEKFFVRQLILFDEN